MAGALVLVGTPIGNLGDLSPRAVEELAQGRRRGLRGHPPHRPPAAARRRAGPRAAGRQRPQRGSAGRRGPAPAGPGRAGRRRHRRGHARHLRPRRAPGRRRRPGTATGSRSCPGPSAAVAALVASGLPTGRFVFEGFLLPQGRRPPLRAWRRWSPTSGRSCSTRRPIAWPRPWPTWLTVLGGWRRVAVARELTKLHEEIWRGHLHEAAAWAEANPPRGEIALVVQGALPPGPADASDVEAAVRGSARRPGTRRGTLRRPSRRSSGCPSGRPTRSPYGYPRGTEPRQRAGLAFLAACVDGLTRLELASDLPPITGESEASSGGRSGPARRPRARC